MTKSFSTMILAAGFGKRMGSLTDKIPKPLIKINNTPLLKNCIDFLLNIGCKKIVINTHYQHKLIFNFINENYKPGNIFISYESDILDTAGAVKNAINFFNEESILVTNSDIFLKKENEKDIIRLVKNFRTEHECKLLLAKKENSFGLINKSGDFYFNRKNQLKRWKNGEKILYYSGIQMFNLNILNNFSSKKFSFNKVWDLQIDKNLLYGDIMKSNLYHVGDKEGLKKAIESLD